jgi:hypothetical protein
LPWTKSFCSRFFCHFQLKVKATWHTLQCSQEQHLSKWLPSSHFSTESKYLHFEVQQRTLRLHKHFNSNLRWLRTPQLKNNLSNNCTHTKIKNFTKATGLLP